MRGDAARELFVQLVLQNKESLFSKNATQEVRRNAWERIRAECGELGAVQFAIKSPKELSNKFSDIKRRTLEKKKAFETSGNAKMTLTTIDNHVLDIISYNESEVNVNESITPSLSRKRSLEQMRGNNEPTSDGKLNNCFFNANGLCSSVNLVPDTENRPSNFTPGLTKSKISDLDTQLKKAKLDYFRMQTVAAEEQIYYFRAKGQEAEIRKKILELEYQERKRILNEETTTENNNSFVELK
ncbi:BED-type domain-containing protein [Meloidogyne graminicola]|uniref:BED-type domain-containing protein n=1 Tax=Meloidogyne graminicola TaxID=189291 RepID=A0A8S9ZC92_9BILA|nr:BED-type domain-containing protein [Meloidogyne graminicola]